MDVSAETGGVGVVEDDVKAAEERVDAVDVAGVAEGAVADTERVDAIKMMP